MLRITKISENGSPLTLKLEGKIHDEWVALLEQECEAAMAAGLRVYLDFAQVTYVAETGMELIRRLLKQIVVINGDTFIADLIDRGGQPWSR